VSCIWDYPFAGMGSIGLRDGRREQAVISPGAAPAAPQILMLLMLDRRFARPESTYP
jgi:hypothetical protein